MSYKIIEPETNCKHVWSKAVWLLTHTAFGAFSRRIQRCVICAGVKDAD